MRFGLFGSAQAARVGPDTDTAAGYREFVDRNIEAEDLGNCSTFLVEHHFAASGRCQVTDRGAAADPAASVLRFRFLKRDVGLCAGSRRPVQTVVLATISGPWIKRVHHIAELPLQLGYGPQQYAFQREHWLRMAVRHTFLHYRGSRPIIHHPIDSQRRIELGPEGRGEETIAE